MRDTAHTAAEGPARCRACLTCRRWTSPSPPPRLTTAWLSSTTRSRWCRSVASHTRRRGVPGPETRLYEFVEPRVPLVRNARSGARSTSNSWAGEGPRQRSRSQPDVGEPARDLPTGDHRHGAAARTGPPGPASARHALRDVTLAKSGPPAWGSHCDEDRTRALSSGCDGAWMSALSLTCLNVITLRWSCGAFPTASDRGFPLRGACCGHGLPDRRVVGERAACSAGIGSLCCLTQKPCRESHIGSSQSQAALSLRHSTPSTPRAAGRASARVC